ncbi:MAG: phosphotransferase family protein [Ilumatobacteraceae bacterium]
MPDVTIDETAEAPETSGGPVGIDVDDVTRWFAEHVRDARPPLRFGRVAGGHSCLTFIVTDADGRRFVLRRPPMGHVLATAHDVAREYRVMAALQDSGVPVPAMIGLSAGADVNGAPFYVMAHVEGAVLHDLDDATTLLPDDAARRRAGETLVDALVALHAVVPADVGLGDLSKGSGYVGRQLRRWSQQWDASATRDRPEMPRLHAWLEAHQPADVPARIAHGDFRLGNAIHRPDGSVAAVLDWELCALGDPMADVSYLLRSWGPPTGGDDGDVGAATGTHASLAPGFPSRAELIARYERGSGRSVDDLAFWITFHCWRSAAITEGVYRRYLDGAMANADEDADRYRQIVEALIVTGTAAAGLA